jgi:4-amino-4-deoxy-L-arabinose transferase-like glycosyltransferase
MTSTAATLPQRRHLAALPVVVLLFLGLRLYFDFKADLVGDEAYYWMWGQHLDWSYFDHPPLHAWLLHLVAQLVGWSRFSVRLLTWASLVLVLWIFHLWSKRLAPADSATWFWRAAALYLASPLFFLFGSIAYNDHLLVALSLLAVHCFVTFVEQVESGRPLQLRWLYGAAVATGLATLTKYNGAFIGLGFAVAVLASPKLRPLLKSPHLWLAGLVAIAIQAPVIWWNARNGFPTVHYHLVDRWGGAAGHFSWAHPLNFILLCALLFSPFLLWPLLRMLRTKPAAGFEASAKLVAVSILATSTLCLLALSTELDAYFYWNIVAFIGILPLLVRFVDPVLRWLHILFGLLIAALFVCDLAVVPPGPLLGHEDHGSSINFGWDEIATHMRQAADAHAPDLFAGTRYSTTSQLGFALHITDAAKLSPEHSEYDFWQAHLPLTGKSALVLTDEPDGSAQIEWLKGHFTTLQQVDAFSITRYGVPLYSWRIFYGERLTP